MEINDVDVDSGRFRFDAGALVNDDLLSLEMKFGGMINDIQVPAIRSFGTAPGVNDSAEAKVVVTFGLSNRAAARQPARALRRRCGTEISTEKDINDRRSVIFHLNMLAKWAEGGPWRQCSFIHADVVIAESSQLD